MLRVLVARIGVHVQLHVSATVWTLCRSRLNSVPWSGHTRPQPLASERHSTCVMEMERVRLVCPACGRQLDTQDQCRARVKDCLQQA